MSLFKKATALVLTLVMVATMCAVPVFAKGETYSITNGTQHNAAIETRQKELEDKYGIYIFYPTYQVNGVDTAAIQVETLNTLDTALSYVTPSFVRKVSTYYYNRNGKRLRYEYRFADLAGPAYGDAEVTVGGFDPERSLIVLYIPHPGNGATISGDAPMTVVHELGHAVQVMLSEQYGESKLKNEWVGYNGTGNSYHPGNIQSNPNDKCFITGYAATDFHEDFAETFAHAFVNNRSGMGFTGKLGTADAPTALGKKYNLIYKLLETYFPDQTGMLDNFQKMYGVSSSYIYKGLNLSGDHLQFIGYPEARYIPLTIFQEYPGIQQSQFKWISDIGGWYAEHNGENIVVFPGGNWGIVNSKLS